MDDIKARIASFNPKRTKGSKSTPLKWPHPSSFQARPETLAEAGFYFDPSAEDPDSVTCFMCEKQLGDWEKEDDPHELHYRKCKNTCAWAMLRCGLIEDMDVDGRYVVFLLVLVSF